MENLMREDRFKSILEPGFWILFGVAGIVGTLEFMEPLPNFQFGAAFWPQVVLISIISIGVFQIIVTYVFDVSDHDSEEPDADKSDHKSAELLTDKVTLTLNSRMIAIFLSPLVYVFAMHKFGFFLVTPVFLPIYMYIMGVRRIRSLIAVSTSVYAAIIFLFVYLVFTPLPQGAGFFHSLNGQFIGFFQ
jgi:hypothetical protein